MRRFRFHLGTLVMLVLLLGVGFAALRESNETWDCSTFSITLGLSFDLDPARRPSNRDEAGILARVRPVRLDYLGLSLVPSIESRLITTKVLAFSTPRCRGRSQRISRTSTTTDGNGPLRPQTIHIRNKAALFSKGYSGCRTEPTDGLA